MFIFVNKINHNQYENKKNQLTRNVLFKFKVACPVDRAVGFKFRIINSDFCYLYKKAQC